MRKFLIASHGKFAAGLFDSLEMISGAQSQVKILEAYTDMDFSMEEKISNIVRDLENIDELVIMTDIPGGSVTHQLAQLIRDHPVYLVAGVNLPLVLEIVLSDPSVPVEVMLQDAIIQSREQMVFVNKLLC